MSDFLKYYEDENSKSGSNNVDLVQLEARQVLNNINVKKLTMKIENHIKRFGLDSSVDDMISSVKKGIFMQTNRSWSIDDFRNKFQFGCEYGTLIEDGKLT